MSQSLTDMKLELNQQTSEEHSEVKIEAKASYSDLPGRDLSKIDLISQLNANLEQVEDLVGRFHFMTKEIKELIRAKA